MNNKVLALDLGTSSIGLAVRNLDRGTNLIDQIEYASVDIFQAGVGTEKSGEYSLAGRRTSYRLARRLYDTRRRRLWATLQLLIEHNLCPLSPDGLKQWKTYDKKQGLYRRYPIGDIAFDRWIKLDFDGDGHPDYESPYQLRALLATTQLDFGQSINRYKLGRALYHIAQRRGFKSSKGETIAEQEKEAKDGQIEDLAQEMKKSEAKTSKNLCDLMGEHGFETVGQAFAWLEKNGERVRNSVYKAVRSQYLDEIRFIFSFQNGLETDGPLFSGLTSMQKGVGTIFYKRPLKSQKGLVGKCTLEPLKPRCPIGHPEYELFRAWSLINNIKYRLNEGDEWLELPLELKQQLYRELFTKRVKRDFPFKDIREFLQRKLGIALQNSRHCRTVNFRDSQIVGGCPVTARLINLLGDDWDSIVIKGNKERTAHSTHPGKHLVSYNALDLWHVCFSTDDVDEVNEFAHRRLGWNDDQTKLLVRLWSAIPQGYAMLSLKAMRNINRLLTRGHLYHDAVALAKLPDLLDIDGEALDQLVKDYDTGLRQPLNRQRTLYSIVNRLIANHKSLPDDERFAFKDYTYKLQDSDYAQVKAFIIDSLGPSKWGRMTGDEQQDLIDRVAQLYQAYFANPSRPYYELPATGDCLKQWLKQKFPRLTDRDLGKLYHHSRVSRFVVPNGAERLGNPDIGAIRNPVVLRTMHVLRDKINALLDAGIIGCGDDSPRVLIETARNFNDANKRWAIETNQRERQKARQEIANIIRQFYPTREINEKDIDRGQYIIDQLKEDSFDDKKHIFSRLITRYKVWLEQGCRCIYTGRVINIKNLFDDNAFDLEHTIPRSKSFDDSDANLTLCDAFYNRTVKRNRMPTELENYEHDTDQYSAIKPRLEAWEKRVERIRENIEYWKTQSSRAQDKERKDRCIRQLHLWRFEMDYWTKKLGHFTQTEVSEGFRHSQLVDTGIITKYAIEYLKTIFTVVEAPTGTATSAFRHMLGIQSMDETKDRSLHTHHAIDAITLSVLPQPARYDSMLKLYYLIQENESLHINCDIERRELEREVKHCFVGLNVSAIVPYINSTLMVNHRAVDRTLVPARKRVKVRGKNILVPDGDGGWRQKWSQGDSIRGRLHKESFYGAIKMPDSTGDGIDRRPMVRDGKFVYGDDQLTMVIRVDLQSFKSEKDLNSIIDDRVRLRVSNVVSQRMAEGLTLQQALALPIWPVNRNGEEVKTDRNGRPLNPIRHIRCRAKTGGGYLTEDAALTIREHVETSSRDLRNIASREHKRYLYAQTDTNYLYLLYEGIARGAVKRCNRIINLFELAQMVKAGVIVRNQAIEQQLMALPQFAHINDKKVDYRLSAIVKVGTRLLMWKDSPDEVLELLNDPKRQDELQKRYFVVQKFSGRKIFIRESKEARNDKQYTIQTSAGKLNCLIEDRDFTVDALGRIQLVNS